MPLFEMNEHYYQRTPDGRPPQLNMTVCGCRCGCGCAFSGEGEGGNSDDEADEVLRERSRGLDDVEQGPSLPFHIQEEIQRVETRHGGYIMSREGFRPDYFAVGSEEMQRAILPGRRLAIGHAESDTVTSTANEPNGTDDQSSASSGELLRIPDIRYGSPGPGIGGWVTLADYYFVKSPLRLTAQRQYCRGLVTAHLIVHDDTTDHHHDSVFPRRVTI
ncbi:uncharacterized protein BDZ99DRAFT_84876 [Mytilinidion resinicola]|uniref:Uncharacterized protein n=1 Tax=Mytilinidion resinicola TaxID=574789 RepID=A0A6A6YFB9_9PEZI|nr:uncharacterized protein BDZ99DRAFT_84876 [Mytilinidion resinicola]KAF2806755.1 hypothetical protein BDZ99DRAFT_84876 [Mytilinidion resinicola]